MVENENELVSAKEVIEILEINYNNLHQIQHRGNIKWVKKEGRKVYYDRASVMAYKDRRDKRGKKKLQAVTN
jgi:predicted site-specific integrase-resolvase